MIILFPVTPPTTAPPQPASTPPANARFKFTPRALAADTWLEPHLGQRTGSSASCRRFSSLIYFCLKWFLMAPIMKSTHPSGNASIATVIQFGLLEPVNEGANRHTIDSNNSRLPSDFIFLLYPNVSVHPRATCGA